MSGAAIDGAAFRIAATVEFGRGRCGKALLTTAKDRGGTHVRGTTAAEFTLDATVTPYVLSLDTPIKSTRVGEDFRPTTLMERISRYVEGHPDRAKDDIERAVAGKTGYIRTALEVLVKEGFVETKPEGRAIRHSSVRPYRSTDDPEVIARREEVTE